MDHNRSSSSYQSIIHVSSVFETIDDHNETNSSSRSFILKRFSSKQLCSLVAILSSSFILFMNTSILASFFPLEASNVGMSQTNVGLIFSMYGAVLLFVGPLSGKYIIPYFGAKWIHLFGLSVSGLAIIFMGLLDFIKDLTVFTCCAFAARFFVCIGTALSFTAKYVYIMKLFPGDVGTVFGLAETCVALGLALGAGVGGLLYRFGGYSLPFYANGLVELLNIPIFYFMVPSIEAEPITQSYGKLLKIPQLALVGVSLLAAMAINHFIDPTLEPHLRTTFGVTATQVSLLFFLKNGIQVILSPLAGWFGGERKNKFYILAVGQLILCISLMLLGPSALLRTIITPTVGLSIVAVAMIGIAFTCAEIPTFESMLKITIQSGLENSTATFSLVSGFFNTFNALGHLSGPALGGFLTDKLGFSWAVTFMAGLALFATILSVFGIALAKHSDKKRAELAEIQAQNSSLTNSPSTYELYGTWKRARNEIEEAMK